MQEQYAQRKYLPRTRGFTTDEHLVVVGVLVSSPCAGVYRIGFFVNPVSCCVFPVRGGTPNQMVPFEMQQACLPRTRGFTRIGDAIVGVMFVSSSYAGVRLMRITRRLTLLCVFPVCGGSPWRA